VRRRRFRASAFFGLSLSLLAGVATLAIRLCADDAKPPDYSAEPFVVEKISASTDVNADGTYNSDTTARVRIQSDAGLQRFGLISFSYASATTNLEIVYVRVTKPGGHIVETGPENILEMPADITRQAPFYSDVKEKQVAVRGLAVGDSLEYEYREHETSALDPGMYWNAYNFFKGGIVLEEDVQISFPSELHAKVVSSQVQPTVAEQNGRKIYTWKTANLEPKSKDANPKPAAKPPDDRPAIQITTYQDWDAVGQWFRSLAAPRAAPGPEVKAKADEITKDAKTEDEKIRLLYAFVSQQFRYIGISLGIGRYQPHSAADVLDNGYGDCKDKHTLFTALLAAEGIKAYPVLIQSSSAKLDPDVPSPGQFDHVITAIPQTDGLLFLDTTTEIAPFGYLVPELRDKQALVIPDQGPAHLVQTPAELPFKSFFHFQADGALDDSGTFKSKMHAEVRGDSEVFYRAALREAGKSKWTDVVQEISRTWQFGGTVSDVVASEPEAVDAPFQLDYSYTRNNYGDWDAKAISAPLPPIYLPEVPDDPAEQAKPLEFYAKLEVHLQATMKLPEHWNTTQLPDPVDLVEPFAEYHCSYTVVDRVLHADRRFAFKVLSIDPGQFAEYKKFQQSVLDSEYKQIALISTTATKPSSPSATPVYVFGSGDAHAAFERGRQALVRGDTASAVGSFKEAVQDDPNFAFGWLLLGGTQIGLGDVSEGMKDVENAVTLDPTNLTAYKSIPPLLIRTNHPDLALEFWKLLEKTAPNDPDPPRNIASYLVEQKHYPEAVQELQTATKIIADNALLYLVLGDALIHNGDPDGATTALRKASSLDSSPQMLNNVAYEFADGNLHLDEALDDAKKAVAGIEAETSKLSLDQLELKDLAEMGQLSAYWDTLGWVYYKRADYTTAEKYLRSAWNLSQYGVIGDHLGQICEKLGKQKEAAQAYRWAIDAGNAPEETPDRLAALHANKTARGGVRDSGSLSNLRTIKLPRIVAKSASADFFLLFGPGEKLTAVKFLSGSDSLRDAQKSLMSADFGVTFPDDGPTQVLRRGRLICDATPAGCEIVLDLPGDVHAIE